MFGTRGNRRTTSTAYPTSDRSGKAPPTAGAGAPHRAARTSRRATWV